MRFRIFVKKHQPCCVWW